MYNYDVKDNIYTEKKRKIFPYFSVGLIIVGAACLIGGGIWYANTDMSKYSSAEIKNVDETIDGSKIKTVDIDCGTADIYIGVSDDGQVHLNGSVFSNYSLKESGGTLRLDTGNSSSFNFNDWNSKSLHIELYLPDKEYNEFMLDTGAGDIDIDGIRCVTTDINTGAGDVDITNMKCSKVFSADTGAGDMDISGTTTGGLDLDLGAGNVTYNGEVYGDIYIDCGVGNCTVNLTNDEKEFSKKYKIDTDEGIGDVDVNFVE